MVSFQEGCPECKVDFQLPVVSAFDLLIDASNEKKCSLWRRMDSVACCWCFYSKLALEDVVSVPGVHFYDKLFGTVPS